MSEDTERVRDAGYDDWLDALESGDPYYLACSNDHGLLPPRRVCPHCGDRALEERSLPEAGSVLAQTTVHVPAPSFQGDAPYTTAVVDFGPVRITGQLSEADAVSNGDTVTVAVGATGQGERLVVFDPA